MKRFLMFFLLTGTMTVFAQVPYDEIQMENQEEAIYSDDNFESEMSMHKQEDFAYPSPSESPEDLMAGEDSYDTESDYNH